MLQKPRTPFSWPHQDTGDDENTNEDDNEVDGSRKAEDKDEDGRERPMRSAEQCLYMQIYHSRSLYSGKGSPMATTATRLRR